MPIKAVQQFMLGTVLSNEQQARETLAAMKAAGYDGIELCGFMIHPIGFVVKLLTKAAGMPVGKGGNLDWHKLVQETGLQVVSLHTDLGSLERDAHAVAEEAKSFGTQHVVITGMYRFDYGDEAAMHELAQRLNKAGEALAAEGIHLLYHNHNCELRHVNAEKRAGKVMAKEVCTNAPSAPVTATAPHRWLKTIENKFADALRIPSLCRCPQCSGNDRKPLRCG